MSMDPLETSHKIYNEILVKQNKDCVTLYESLTPAERIFTYYMYRASLPGNLIYRDQCHRHTNDLIKVFKLIWQNQVTVRNLLPEAMATGFIKDCETYLVYLIANHGFYFCRESHHEKRLPKQIGLKYLTSDSLQKVLDLMTEIINPLQLSFPINSLVDSVFNETYQLSCCVPKSITDSGCNIYQEGFTDKDFERLPTHEKTQINAYFYKDGDQPRSQPYCIGGHYSQELRVCRDWLQLASNHSKQYPEYFDINLIESLDHMIRFLETGSEDDFILHSRAWLKSNSRIDFSFGFIESYQDPQSYRGFFQADCCIKSIDVSQINALIPHMEAQMPLKPEYKRDPNNTQGLMNVSMDQKIFGTGSLGPADVTAAYCLPNYDYIREQDGSKQIIYSVGQSIGQLIDPQKSMKLMNLREQYEWKQANDPNDNLSADIWNLQCILHESIGHGSGKYSDHIVTKKMIFKGQEYQVGDKIKVTQDLYNQMMLGYDHAIEEMRAEINALYISVANLPELMEIGLLSRWEHLDQAFLIDQLILGMASTGLRRYIEQPDAAIEITSDNALANSTITFYLVMNGGLEVVEETVEVESDIYTVVGLKIKDRILTLQLIEELMIKVQTIKSTADGDLAQQLIKQYGKPIHNMNHLRNLKRNVKACVGNVKVTVELFPELIPCINNDGQIIDIEMKWPINLICDAIHKDQLALLSP
jgi:hypothetical protein